MSLENEGPAGVVFPEHRHACLEDEVGTPLGIDQRHTTVEDQMKVPVRLVAGVPENTERMKQVPVEAELRDEAAEIRLVHENGAAGEPQRSDTGQEDLAQRDAGRRATR